MLMPVRQTAAVVAAGRLQWQSRQIGSEDSTGDQRTGAAELPYTHAVVYTGRSDVYGHDTIAILWV